LILSFDKLAAVAVFEGLEQDSCGGSGFSDRGGANKDNVLGLGDEVEFGEGADLLAVDRGLAGERKRFQRPALGEIGALDAPLQGGFLTGVPLRAQQAQVRTP